MKMQSMIISAYRPLGFYRIVRTYLTDMKNCALGRITCIYYDYLHTRGHVKMGLGSCLVEETGS
jgi:hypothetical protein